MRNNAFKNRHNNCFFAIKLSMKKVINYLSDIAVMTGCCLGVGFVSRKEAQVYFGNALNVIVFAVIFTLITTVFREYCRRKQCNTMEKLSHSLFKKGGTVFDTLISLCCFVCIVTALAGAEQCFDQTLHIAPIPLYGLACAVIAGITLKNGDKALKIANAVSIALAIILVVILLCRKNFDTVISTKISPLKPVVYALFSATMSFGVTVKLGYESDFKRNLICPAAAAVILALFMTAIINVSDFSLNLPAIDNIQDTPTKVFALVTLAFAAVTGIVACAYPIVEQIYPVMPDSDLCCVSIFGLALAFSMFGFDFAVKAGYVLVGVIGLVTVVSSAVQLALKTPKKAL